MSSTHTKKYYFPFDDSYFECFYCKKQSFFPVVLFDGQTYCGVYCLLIVRGHLKAEYQT